MIMFFLSLDLDLTVDQDKFTSISEISRKRLTERRNTEERHESQVAEGS